MCSPLLSLCLANSNRYLQYKIESLSCAAVNFIILFYRYFTVQTTQTIELPAQSLPIIQWKSNLLLEKQNDNSLFLINELANHDLDVNAQLVVMSKTLNTQLVNELAQYLIEKGIKQARIENLGEVEKVGFIRLTLADDVNQIKNLMNEFIKNNDCDFAVLASLPDFAKPGLVLMDMDSTTIQIECIDEIARLYNVGDEVAAVTAAAMRGELDFNGSLRTRVSKLAGAPESVIKQVADNMPLMPGLKALIAGLKAAGWKVAIASGGFTYFANRLKEDHGFDAAYANTLEIVDNKLTGEVVGEILNADVKARTLQELADKFAIKPQQTVAIGDGANDLVMMAASAMGIAIHAKPIVQEKASVALNNLDLEGALCILTASLPLSE